jgi:hypothetical protein
LDYLDYLQQEGVLRAEPQEGVLRAEPLVPADHPLEAADHAIASEAWKDIRFEGNEVNNKWLMDHGWAKMSVRKQALGAISAIYRPSDDIRYMYSHKGKYPWDEHLAAAALLKTRWDATAQRYVQDD